MRVHSNFWCNFVSFTTCLRDLTFILNFSIKVSIFLQDLSVFYFTILVHQFITLVWLFQSWIFQCLQFRYVQYLAQSLVFFLMWLFVDILLGQFVSASCYCKCDFVFLVFHNNLRTQNAARCFINSTEVKNIIKLTIWK